MVMSRTTDGSYFGEEFTKLNGNRLFRSKSKLSDSARILRRSYRRAIQSVKYGHSTLQNAPVFFVNSFPKSGTHLLTQIIEGFAKIGPAVISGLPAVVNFDGHTGRKRNDEEIIADLLRLQSGDITYGHLHASRAILDHLSKPGFVVYFLLRDPRDVVVSHAHYLAEMAPGHVHYQLYKEELKDFNSRLRASILGITTGEHNNPMMNGEKLSFPDISERFKPYQGWLANPDVLVIRYEALINELENTIERIINFAVGRGFQPRFPHDKCIQILQENIDPARSPTFRTGKTGNWKSAFDEQTKEIFRNTGGKMLVELGYEKNGNW